MSNDIKTTKTEWVTPTFDKVDVTAQTEAGLLVFNNVENASYRGS